MAAKTMEEIAALLKGVRFKHKIFGGVREADVWRTLEKLQKEYRSLMEAEQTKAEALIEEREETIRLLKGKLKVERERAEELTGERDETIRELRRQLKGERPQTEETDG